MKILSGKIINEKIKSKLFRLARNLKVTPSIVIVQIGNDSVSNIYISQKIKFAEAVGAKASVIKFNEKISQKKIIEEIKKINSDKSVQGIIVQLPIPQKYNKNEIIDAIDPAKDVDGLTSANITKLLRNEEGGIVPATTRGIFELLDYYKIKIAGKNVVILGRSNLVGRPTAIQFLNNDSTVTICHSKTKNIKKVIASADIVVSAVGKPEFLNSNLFSSKQIIIGVGISHNKNGKLVGDIKTSGLNAAAITPVPGGIGPMTVACLFKNLFDSCKNI